MLSRYLHLCNSFFVLYCFFFSRKTKMNSYCLCLFYATHCLSLFLIFLHFVFLFMKYEKYIIFVLFLFSNNLYATFSYLFFFFLSSVYNVLLFFVDLELREWDISISISIDYYCFFLVRMILT